MVSMIQIVMDDSHYKQIGYNMPCKFDLGRKMSKMSSGKPFFTTFANICSFFALLMV